MPFSHILPSQPSGKIPQRTNLFQLMPISTFFFIPASIPLIGKIFPQGIIHNYYLWPHPGKHCLNLIRVPSPPKDPQQNSTPIIMSGFILVFNGHKLRAKGSTTFIHSFICQYQKFPLIYLYKLFVPPFFLIRALSLKLIGKWIPISCQFHPHSFIHILIFP